MWYLDLEVGLWPNASVAVVNSVEVGHATAVAAFRVILPVTPGTILRRVIFPGVIAAPTIQEVFLLGVIFVVTATLRQALMVLPRLGVNGF